MISSIESLQTLKEYFLTRKEEIEKGIPENIGYTSEKKYIAQVLYIIDVAENIIRKSNYEIELKASEDIVLKDGIIENDSIISANDEVLVLKNNDPIALTLDLGRVKQSIGDNYVVVGVSSYTEVLKGKIVY